MNTCASCLHSIQQKGAAGRACRRFPPSVHMVPQPHPLNPNQMQMVSMSLFPVVNDDQTCGEHVGGNKLLAAN